MNKTLSDEIMYGDLMYSVDVKRYLKKFKDELKQMKVDGRCEPCCHGFTQKDILKLMKEIFGDDLV